MTNSSGNAKSFSPPPPPKDPAAGPPSVLPPGFLPFLFPMPGFCFFPGTNFPGYFLPPAFLQAKPGDLDAPADPTVQNLLSNRRKRRVKYRRQASPAQGTKKLKQDARSRPDQARNSKMLDNKPEDCLMPVLIESLAEPHESKSPESVVVVVNEPPPPSSPRLAAAVEGTPVHSSSSGGKGSDDEIRSEAEFRTSVVEDFGQRCSQRVRKPTRRYSAFVVGGAVDAAVDETVKASFTDEWVNLIKKRGLQDAAGEKRLTADKDLTDADTTYLEILRFLQTCTRGAAESAEASTTAQGDDSSDSLGADSTAEDLLPVLPASRRSRNVSPVQFKFPPESSPFGKKLRSVVMPVCSPPPPLALPDDIHRFSKSVKKTTRSSDGAVSSSSKRSCNSFGAVGSGKLTVCNSSRGQVVPAQFPRAVVTHDLRGRGSLKISNFLGLPECCDITYLEPLDQKQFWCLTMSEFSAIALEGIINEGLRRYSLNYVKFCSSFLALDESELLGTALTDSELLITPEDGIDGVPLLTVSRIRPMMLTPEFLRQIVKNCFTSGQAAIVEELLHRSTAVEMKSRRFASYQYQWPPGTVMAAITQWLDSVTIQPSNRKRESARRRPGTPRQDSSPPPRAAPLTHLSELIAYPSLPPTDAALPSGIASTHFPTTSVWEHSAQYSQLLLLLAVENSAVTETKKRRKLAMPPRIHPNAVLTLTEHGSWCMEVADEKEQQLVITKAAAGSDPLCLMLEIVRRQPRMLEKLIRSPVTFACECFDPISAPCTPTAVNVEVAGEDAPQVQLPPRVGGLLALSSLTPSEAGSGGSAVTAVTAAEDAIRKSRTKVKMAPQRQDDSMTARLIGRARTTCMALRRKGCRVRLPNYKLEKEKSDSREFKSNELPSPTTPQEYFVRWLLDQVPLTVLLEPNDSRFFSIVDPTRVPPLPSPSTSNVTLSEGNECPTPEATELPAPDADCKNQLSELPSPPLAIRRMFQVAIKRKGEEKFVDYGNDSYFLSHYCAPSFHKQLVEERAEATAEPPRKRKQGAVAAAPSKKARKEVTPQSNTPCVA